MAVNDDVADNILSGKIVDPQIACDDIMLLDVPGLYRLFICSIVVDQTLRHTSALRVLWDVFSKQIYHFAKTDIYFRDIISDAFTPHGRQLCAHVGMKPVCTSAHGSTVFYMTMMPPSFVPVTMLQRRIYDRYKRKSEELSLFKDNPQAGKEIEIGVPLADISPELRALDLAIAQVELTVRRIIQDELGNDKLLLPTNIRPAVEERIRCEMKSNAGFDKNRYSTLEGMLEFFDLRELQATIENKTLWSKFQLRFVTKELLSAKFGQLAALRNAIRHVRTVDKIVQKEGEAAVLWFDRVLSKSTTADKQGIAVQSERGAAAPVVSSDKAAEN
jgi:hypothetical protein